MFDASKPFVVPILSGGEKSCEVRFPSDEEWCAWARAQRTVRHFLGRGKSQSEDVDLPKINAELFAKIRTDPTNGMVTMTVTTPLQGICQ